MNVKTFGAAGDGKTDDTEAVQKALDAAAFTSVTDPLAISPGRVFFPPGHYRITEPLKLERRHGRLVIEGAGGVDTFGAGPLSDVRRLPRAISQLVWDGEEGGTLVDVYALGGLIVRNIALVGSNKAGVLLRVNSRPGGGSGRYTFYNTVFADAGTGIETGAEAPKINAADMTLYDCLFRNLKTGFHTRAGQNVDYAFIRPHFSGCAVGLHFEEGGNVYAALPTFIGCRLAIQIDRGGVNVGAFAFDSLHIEQGPYQILKASGTTTVYFSALSPQNQRRSREDGFVEPLFELSDGAHVVITASNITNPPIARIVSENRPTFLQMTNCRFGGLPGFSVDPRLERNIVVEGENAGFEVRNSFGGGGFIREYGRYPKEAPPPAEDD